MKTPKKCVQRNICLPEGVGCGLEALAVVLVLELIIIK